MNRKDILDLFDLTGRVAIVTGGSSGIGEAMAMGFAAMGAKVVIASRRPGACEAASSAITADGGVALAIPTHAGDLDQLAHLVDHTVEVFGGLDIIVNNAANALALPATAITAAAWTKTHDVNVRGPFFLVQRALPYLSAHGQGSVINVVSSEVFRSGAGVIMYHASKSALLAITRSMAAELSPHVRVNALAPGTVDTHMMRNNTDKDQARMVRSSVMRRLASPDEMVGPALFLASQASSYVTGEVLVADGGMCFH
jgi:NAD(P)-dependent dehydrogenase (short-subunit alcohol dehydrogenase family)